MALDMKDKYALIVSKWACYRARRKALKMLRGSLESHYSRLHAYRSELKRVDPKGNFKFETESSGPNGQPVFRRMHGGFSSLRKGYMLACRPCICLGGCFLKTLIGGALLSAIRRDANNQMFPIAWAVVEGENENNWRRFLEHLFGMVPQQLPRQQPQQVPLASARQIRQTARDKRKANQGYRVMFSSESGNFYARMLGEKRARYVSGLALTSAVARNLLNSQQQEVQATSGSQPMASQEES